MLNLAHNTRERLDPVAVITGVAECPCAYRDCPNTQLVRHGEGYLFCIRHLLRVDRKLGLKQDLLESLAQIPAPSENRPDVQSDGVVYFMLIGEEVKIGFTTDLKTRAKCLKADRVLAYFPGDRQSESTAHAAFAQWRSHGEYFHATPECLAAIHRLTNRSNAA